MTDQPDNPGDSPAPDRQTSPDANSSFTFRPSDFTWTFATGNPPPGLLSPALNALAQGTYGYNNPGVLTAQRDLLNGSFFNAGFIEGANSKTLTFHHPGDTGTVHFGYGVLTENTIISRPIGTPGAEDFSYPYDPAHPEELNVKLDVQVLGLPLLHFIGTPQVTAGPSLGLLQADPASPYHAEVLGLSRTDPAPNAPADLPGGFRDANRFVLRFDSQDFSWMGDKYTASIETFRFDTYANPAVAPVTIPGNSHNPVDFEQAILKITLDTVS